MTKKKKLSKLIPRRRKKQVTLEEAVQAAPRITNETVAEHREEVLSTARKYIYPLQHSKHKIVLFSTAIFIAAFVGFFAYTTIALYRVKSYSTFLYRVTQVLPFPIAKAGPSFVAYENYLFELRHYVHYYQDQQKLDFKSKSGQQQLTEFKKRALQKVVDDAYIKQLAKEKGVKVTDKEVNDEIAIVRAQNRLGGSDKVFEDVLKEYWGWSLDDFKRSLRQQILAEKLLPVLDPATVQRANNALAELKGGADFAAVAKKYSDDPTKDAGGEFGFPVDRTSRDVPAQTTAALFKLKAGQYSDIINTGTTLEIVKTLEIQGDKAKGAHIVFTFKDIQTFLNDLKEQRKAHLFIKN